MDLALFHVINGLAGKNHITDELMAFCAVYMPWVFIALLVGLWFTRKPISQGTVLITAAATSIALAIGQAIGWTMQRPRPYVHHAAILLVGRTSDFSFPSDHATFAFSIVWPVLAQHRKMGFLMLAMAIWLCFARVFVGAHYPGDVLGGAVLGSVVSLSVLRFLRDRREVVLTPVIGFFHNLHLG